MYKKGKKFLALFLSMFFLFAGCNGEDRPYEQLCDINTAIELKLDGLQDSGEEQTRYIFINDYEYFQSVRDELQTINVVELPRAKEKTFKDNVFLLIVHTVSMLKDYEYQVKEITADQETLFVQAELAEDSGQWGSLQLCYRIVLIRLDKELVQDVQKVSVKTERVEKMFRKSSDALM